MQKTIKYSLVLLASLWFLQNCKHDSDEMLKADPKDPIVKDTFDYRLTVSDTCRFDTLYFVNDILPILTKNCATSTCHDATSQAGKIVLSDYENVIKTGGVVPYQTLKSKLYTSLIHSDPDSIMPPPPNQKLTLELINAINLWISQGAKNNSCRNICDTSSVKFGANILPIINSTCSGCHSGSNPSGAVRLTNYSNIGPLAKNGILEGTIRHKTGFKKMPPGGQMDSCSMHKISKWIREGAKDD